MSNNPYAAPQLPAEPNPSDQPRRRPLGIAILSVVHVLVGVVFCFIALMMLGTFSETAEWAREQQIPLALLFSIAPIICLLSFAVGVGLWQGRRWAWWLATYLNSQTILNQLGRVVTQYSQQFFLTNLHHFVFILVASITLAIPILVFAYYFRRNVRAYFRLKIGTFASILLLFGVNLLILFLFVAVFIVLRVTGAA